MNGLQLFSLARKYDRSVVAVAVSKINNGGVK